MPSANKLSTAITVDVPAVEGRYAELDEFTVRFESYPEDSDPALLHTGLPDDRCQCPHWGVVESGQITFRWADREETYGAGDAYYVPPGHTPLVAGGTSVVEFSPTAELAETLAALRTNLAACGITW